MTKGGRRRANTPARPIKTKRDYEGASTLVKRLSRRTNRNAGAELRLQSLLRELEKFDDPEDNTSADLPGDYNDSGPRRRWSDDASSAD